jgi:hypothetical protein
MGSGLYEGIYWRFFTITIMTAHNKWLSKTRSISYWTTSVFSSTVTNDERRITAHKLNSLTGTELLYDWRFTASQFVLVTSPLRLKRSYFIFQLNICGYSPYVTSSLTRGWGLSFTIAAGRRQRSHFQVRVPRDLWPHFTASRYETPRKWKTSSPYLYPPETWWPGYKPRHWLPFSSPPTTRRAPVEVFDPASTRHLNSPAKSKSHCDWRPVSLTRGWVCLLYMLLALASVVFLRSESLGTRDLILLSQIWDFPFRRLLRLAGSRWRY